jgi:hypothetical protein
MLLGLANMACQAFEVAGLIMQESTDGTRVYSRHAFDISGAR